MPLIPTLHPVEKSQIEIKHLKVLPKKYQVLLFESDKELPRQSQKKSPKLHSLTL